MMKFQTFLLKKTGLMILAASAAVLATLLLPAGPVLADVAPPETPPGANLVPGSGSTQVRMVSEIVTLDVQPTQAVDTLGYARVEVVFNMNNQGSAEEQMDVRFPLTFWDGRDNGFGDFPEIKDFQAQVNGQQAATHRSVEKYSSQNGVPSAVFKVTFPPGKDVKIRVTYTAHRFGYAPYVAYRYMLETGAGWKDSIGSADLIVRLPYEANTQNVEFTETTGFSTTSAGATTSGRELRWHYDNLEPTDANNLWVSLVVPGVWQNILKEKDNVTRNPSDGEAWGRLGKWAKQLVIVKHGMRSDPGGVELYQQSLKAYQKSVTLLPKDGLWHAGYAELLWNHYLWEVYYAGNNDKSELVQTLKELKLSQQYAPNNQTAVDVLQYISSQIPEAVEQNGQSFTLLALTGTPAFDAPTPWPTDIGDTATPPPGPTRQAQQPTQTRVPPTEVALAPAETESPPAVQPTAAASKPSSRPSLPCCSGVGFLLAGAVVLKRPRKRCPRG
jgi:hypothetical protein